MIPLSWKPSNVAETLTVDALICLGIKASLIVLYDGNIFMWKLETFSIMEIIPI